MGLRRVGDAGGRGEGRKFDQKDQKWKAGDVGTSTGAQVFPKHEPAYGWRRATEGGSEGEGLQRLAAPPRDFFGDSASHL